MPKNINSFTIKHKSCALILTVILSCLLFSCSENKPVIGQVFWQINKFHDIEKQIYYDRLSLFIDAQDEDGLEDLKTLYLINDREEVFWKITDKTWIQKTNNDESWFGSNTIAMHDFSFFPAGRYRIILLDDAGEREETEIILPAYEKGFSDEAFPSAVIRDNTLFPSVNSEAVWFYSTEMVLLNETAVNEKARREITIPEKAKYIFIYRYDRINGYGLVAGPYIKSRL